MTNKKKTKELQQIEEHLKDESKEWDDYYYIQSLDLFYRKDKYGIWYDTEGFRVTNPFFIKGKAFISLNGKTCREALSFKDKILFTSIQNKLVQLGKIVFDEQLVAINFLGQKVTEIGKTHIVFSPDDIVQEVFLSKNKMVFIHLMSGEPFILNNEEIVEHLETVNKANLRFEVFSSENHQYWTQHDSKNLLRVDDDPISIDSNSIIQLDNSFLAKASKHKTPNDYFYVYLENLNRVSITEIDKENIKDIGIDPIELKGNLLYNIQTEHENYVYNSKLKSLYQASTDIGFQNFQLLNIPGFEAHYCYLITESEQLLFDKNTEKIVKVEGITIGSILSKSTSKLLNARDENGNSLVLDARYGLDKLRIAKSQNQKLISVEESTYNLANKILQSAQLSTLGGTEQRLVDLNSSELKLFCLPEDLLLYSEQTNMSLFSGRPICSVDFDNEIEIDGVGFLEAIFVNFTDQLEPVIIQRSNAKPLHLVGSVHRNELISSLQSHTLEKAYYLGANRMLSAITITEDGSKEKMLFSLNKLNSWLTFYDQFLPIFEDVVELKEYASWDYYLFELREKKKESNYIAVEKESPNRLLVEKKGSNYFPKIVKRKKLLLQIPEEVSALRKLFLEDPGVLMDCE